MIRLITIRSRYEEAACEACGARVTLDFGPEGYDGDPIEVTTHDDHEDDCPQAPAEKAAPALMGIEVRRSSSHNDGRFFAYIHPNMESPIEHLTIGLIYGATPAEAAGNMLGILGQLNLLDGRTIPIVFAED